LSACRPRDEEAANVFDAEEQDALEKIVVPEPRRFSFDYPIDGFSELSPNGKFAFLRKRIPPSQIKEVPILFDLEKGKVVGPVPSYGLFSPDGKRWVHMIEDEIILDELGKGEKVHLQKVVPVYFPPMRFSADGNFLVGGDRVWDARSGKQIHRWNVEAGPGFVREKEYSYLSGNSTRHYFSADGFIAIEIMVPARSLDRLNFTQDTWKVHIWNFTTGRYCGQAGLTTYSHGPERLSERPHPATPPYTKLKEIGAVGHDCFGVRISPGGRPVIFPRMPRGAIEVTEPEQASDGKGLMLRDRVTRKILHRFMGSGLLFYRLSDDGSTFVQWGPVGMQPKREKVEEEVVNPTESKLGILVWDVTAFRKHAGRERPPLRAAEWEAHWVLLAHDDPREAFKAMRRLAASPGQTLPILKQRLQPVEVENVDLAAQIAELDGPLAQRQKAEARLRAAGDEAIPFLEKALQPKPPHFAPRIETILKDLKDAWLPDPTTRRLLWSIELLEFVGTKEAKQILQRLGEGTPTAWVTLEAKKSLERLNK
jgi:hypothetical protein